MAHQCRRARSATLLAAEVSGLVGAHFDALGCSYGLFETLILSASAVVLSIVMDWVI